eukprot:g1693.t1
MIRGSAESSAAIQQIHDDVADDSKALRTRIKSERSRQRGGLKRKLSIDNNAAAASTLASSNAQSAVVELSEVRNDNTSALKKLKDRLLDERQRQKMELKRRLDARKRLSSVGQEMHLQAASAAYDYYTSSSGDPQNKLEVEDSLDAKAGGKRLLAEAALQGSPTSLERTRNPIQRVETPDMEFQSGAEIMKRELQLATPDLSSPSTSGRPPRMPPHMPRGGTPMLSDLGRGIHTSATDRTREPFLLSRAEEDGQSGRLLDTGGTVDLGRGIHTAATYIPSSRGTGTDTAGSSISPGLMPRATQGRGIYTATEVDDDIHAAATYTPYSRATSTADSSMSPGMMPRAAQGRGIYTATEENDDDLDFDAWSKKNFPNLNFGKHSATRLTTAELITTTADDPADWRLDLKSSQKSNHEDNWIYPCTGALRLPTGLLISRSITLHGEEGFVRLSHDESDAYTFALEMKPEATKYDLTVKGDEVMRLLNVEQMALIGSDKTESERRSLMEELVDMLELIRKNDDSDDRGETKKLVMVAKEEPPTT